MLYSLLDSVFVLDSIVYRSVWAFFTALVVVLASGGRVIGFLKQHQGKGQPIREDGPKSHLETKKGTPTMGGLMILGSSILAVLLWADWENLFVASALLVYVAYAIIGFVDDYGKVKKNSTTSLSGKLRLMIEFLIALVIAAAAAYNTQEGIRFELSLPYLKNVALNLSWFYIPFAMFVIVGTANSVNLSDGLDGLAGGLCVVAFLVFAVIAFVAGSEFSQYFMIMPVVGVDELAVVCAAVVGGCIGFLWFNAPPAKIFMGDTGSLALGGLLGSVAVMTKHEIVLAIVGGIFVIEALSDIIQVFWYRRTKRRVFLMAPIHHHFEQLGWKETTVVLRFWIVAFMLGIIGLLSLMPVGE